MNLTTIREGLIKRIHVDRRVLATNAKHGRNDPAWTIQTSKGPIKCSIWSVKGKTKASPPGKKLSCGARMWIETTAEVEYA